MSADEVAFPRHRLGDIVPLVLLYAGLGPPLGALLVFFLLSISAMSFGGFGTAALLLPVMKLSYPVGGVPALVCGLAAAREAWRGRAIPYRDAMIVGGVATALFMTLSSAIRSFRLDLGTDAVIRSFLLALVGASAAAACRWIGGRLRGKLA